MGTRDDTNRPAGERKFAVTRMRAAENITPGIGIGGDDLDNLQTCVTTLNAEGGGRLLITKPLKIGSDWALPRNVVLVGEDPTYCRIHSLNSNQRTVTVTGVPADTPGFDGDDFAVERLCFDKVTLEFGDTASDVPRGMKAFRCQFVNSTIGLRIEGNPHQAFAGVGAVLCKFRLCEYGVVFSYAGPHHTLNNCDISECSLAAILVDNMATDGISLFIQTVYSDHCRRFLKVQGTVTDGGIYITGGGAELIGTSNVGSYADGYCIEMNGGQVWIEQFQCFNGPHTTATFKVDGGTLYDGGGRRYWDDNEYARITAGTIQVDQTKIFSPGRLWGTNQAPFALGSSSGGKIVAPRHGFICRTSLDGSASNAAPTFQYRLAETWDGNEREITLDFSSGGTGTISTLRVQLADGVTSPFADIAFPVGAAVNGTIRIVHEPGVGFTISAHYSLAASVANVPGVSNPPTPAEMSAIVIRLNLLKVTYILGAAGGGVISSTRFLQFTTLNGGGTASQFTFVNLREVASGPNQVGI